MDRKTVLSAVGVVAFSAGMALAGTDPGTGVVGSIHDMNIYLGATPDSQGRVCAFCHTPHHALMEGNDYLPLWSHDLPNTTYTPYNTATIDSTIDVSTMMEGPSKLCMSCHDGAIAVDTHYSTTGTKVLDSDDWDGAAIAKTDSLHNDHPIGFIFDVDDGGIAAGPVEGNPDSNSPSEQGQDKWIRTKEATYIDNIVLKIEDRLYQGTQGLIMTCATCHDVHNKKNVEAPGNANYLLLSPNDGSKLCLSCHIK